MKVFVVMSQLILELIKKVTHHSVITQSGNIKYFLLNCGKM